MGLRLTLTKEKNAMYHDFIDAYWAISEVIYTPEAIGFKLRAYPSRDSKLKNGTEQENPSIGYGSGAPYVSSKLYEWNVTMDITNIFPDGIPASRDAQYTAIYNWIKEYTELPFEDVFEEE